LSVINLIPIYITEEEIFFTRSLRSKYLFKLLFSYISFHCIKQIKLTLTNWSKLTLSDFNLVPGLTAISVNSHVLYDIAGISIRISKHLSLPCYLTLIRTLIAHSTVLYKDYITMLFISTHWFIKIKNRIHRHSQLAHLIS
jgi:hypothetical protein